MFTVIMPTLQRSEVTPTLVDMYCAHPLVHEVIIVNNASTPYFRGHAKIRILDQNQNIFVNPAWNLGVVEAQSKFIIISNDDILFDPHVIDVCARALCLPVGIIGPDESSFQRAVDGSRLGARLARPFNICLA